MLHEEDTEQHGRDVERLEQMLAERGREVLQLRSEIERQSVLIRDLTARWEQLPQGALVGAIASGDAQVGAIAAYKQQRDAAIARALDAEAAALEARFRVDELSGHLAKALDKPDQGALHRDEVAALEGMVRGLRSRLAEAEDARDRAEARLMLAEHDLDDVRAEGAVLKRQRLELTERLELEALRARSAEGELASLRGERLGLAARAADSERSVEALQERAASSSDTAASLEVRVCVALAERDAARGALLATREDRDRVAIESADLREQVGRLQAELSARQSDLAEREADLATVRASHGDVSEARDRATSLHEALLDARQGLRELSAWLASGRPTPSELASTTSFELESPLGESTRPPREDETLPGVPLHVEAIAAVENMAVEALEEQLARKDEQLRALEARIDELMRRQGRF